MPSASVARLPRLGVHPVVRQRRGAGHVEPLPAAGHPHARLVDAGAGGAPERPRDRRLRRREGRAADRLRRLQRALGRRGAEEVLEELLRARIGHQLIGVQVDAHRLEPVAVLHRLRHAPRERSRRLSATGRAGDPHHPVLDHRQPRRRQLEHLPPLGVQPLLCPGGQAHPAAGAVRRPVEREAVGRGHQAQRDTGVPRLAPRRPARRARRRPQTPRCRLRTAEITRRGLAAVVAVQRHPVFERRDAPLHRREAADQALDQRHHRLRSGAVDGQDLLARRPVHWIHRPLVYQPRGRRRNSGRCPVPRRQAE